VLLSYGGEYRGYESAHATQKEEWSHREYLSQNKSDHRESFDYLGSSVIYKSFW